MATEARFSDHKLIHWTNPWVSLFLELEGDYRHPLWVRAWARVSFFQNLCIKKYSEPSDPIQFHWYTCKKNATNCVSRNFDLWILCLVSLVKSEKQKLPRFFVFLFPRIRLTFFMINSWTFRAEKVGVGHWKISNRKKNRPEGGIEPLWFYSPTVLKTAAWTTKLHRGNLKFKFAWFQFIFSIWLNYCSILKENMINFNPKLLILAQHYLVFFYFVVKCQLLTFAVQNSKPSLLHLNSTATNSRRNASSMGWNLLMV